MAQFLDACIQALNSCMHDIVHSCTMCVIILTVSVTVYMYVCMGITQSYMSIIEWVCIYSSVIILRLTIH